MDNENKNGKAPKTKKEKVIIRKCHHCGKPLDDGKDFCLHCGHTYTEEDPRAAEKTAKRQKRLKKLLISLGIVVGVALIIALFAFLIVREINKSDYLRITEFIKSEGDFVDGTPEDELEFASQLEAEKELESIKDANKKDEESTETGTEEGTESGTESEIEAGAVAKASSSEDDEEESESQTETEEESAESEEDEGRVMDNIETLDRYEYEINSTTTLACTEEDETRFFVIYKDTVDNFYTKIIIEISDENPDEYLWSALVSYEDNTPGSGQYNFVRQYHGTFDPADFTSKEGSVEVYKKAETIEDKTDTEQSTEQETESESDTEAEPQSMSDIESSTEDESSTEESTGGEDEENPDGEEEEDEPQLSIEESIERAALQMVSLQVREMILDLYECIEENNINATLDELGFTKYFEYLESLDPLKNR